MTERVMATLEQRRLWKRRHAEVLPDRVRIAEQGLFQDERFSFPYEGIESSRFEITTRSKGWFWTAALLAWLAVATAAMIVVGEDVPASTPWFWGGTATIAELLYLGSRQSYVGFPTTKGPLLLWSSSPSRSDVETFLEAIQREQAVYLRRAYPPTPVPALSTVEQLERLEALRERGAITTEEFERLKANLIDPPPIGPMRLN